MVKTMQIKTCRKKRHVVIDSMKEKPNLICGKAAVGGNYNSTRDMYGTSGFTGQDRDRLYHATGARDCLYDFHP